MDELATMISVVVAFVALGAIIASSRKEDSDRADIRRRMSGWGRR